MLLGKYEAEAQPHLVVFAPSKGYKKVESFFAKEDINDLLTIWSTGLASIPIIVTSHPDTGFLTASHCISDVPALCSSDYRQEQLNTFCGVPICIGSRQLTFGGIIRVLGYEDENGSVVDKMLFGISAGHLVDGDDEQEEEDGDIDESSDDLNDDTRPTIVSLSALSSPPPLLAETQKWRWSGETSLGRVLEFHDIDPAKPGLDWSLIKMNNLLPNIIDAKPGDGLQKGHLITPRTQSAIGSPSRSVVVMSGAQGIQRGTLHFVPTRVILGRSEAFSDAYILKLSGGFIGQGDLGSWVVDTTTYEVFGHVVAKDALGDGIVIPMWDILRDIKSHLRGSDVVELPDFLPDTIAVDLPRCPSTDSHHSKNLDSGYGINVICSPEWTRASVLTACHRDTEIYRTHPDLSEQKKRNTSGIKPPTNEDIRAMILSALTLNK